MSAESAHGPLGPPVPEAAAAEVPDPHLSAPPPAPGESGVLKPADRDLLAAAIREGMAPEPASWSGMIKSLLFVVAVASGLIGGYQALQRWRPAIPLALSADQTVASRQITFGGDAGGVRWMVNAAEAASMQVTGPENNRVEIDVPLPSSACSQVAADLGPSARCVPSSAGEVQAVEFPSPLSIDWASPVPVELLPPSGSASHQSPALGVTVTSPALGTTASGSTPVAPAPARSAQQTPLTGTGSAITFVAANGSDQQRWCFDSPLSANQLRLQRGANRSVHDFTGSEADIACGSGLRLIIGLPGSNHQPAAVTVQDIASLRMEARSSQEDAQSVVGQLHLGPSGAPVLGTPTELVVRAQPRSPLDAVLVMQAGRSTLSLKAARATSVLTDSGNLVTSAWVRYQALALPILLALAGGLVPILLSTMQGLMAAHRVRNCRPQSS